MSNLNLKNKYQQEIIPKLAKEMGLKNHLAVPRVEKIVINMGVGEGANDKRALNEPSQVMEIISGQTPKVARAKKSEAGFRLREGAPIGLVVTLRGKRMYDFLEKLIKVVFPRVRDFQGVSRGSFDGQGNYSVGFTEYNVFPEVDYAKVEKSQGLEVTLVTSSRGDQKAERLLSLLGIPFKKDSS
ncbi:50S ribosomal protein L5 [Patescibacteria group bacterium]